MFGDWALVSVTRLVGYRHIVSWHMRGSLRHRWMVHLSKSGGQRPQSVGESEILPRSFLSSPVAD
jgi:hypothetical protein